MAEALHEKRRQQWIENSISQTYIYFSMVVLAVGDGGSGGGSCLLFVCFSIHLQPHTELL